MKWLAQLKEDGKTVKALEDVPEVLPHALWLWAAFNSLSRKRLITPEGPQPIPVSEILAYAVYYDIPSGDPRTDLMDIVSLLDETFLLHVAKERKKRDKQASARGASPFRGKHLKRR